MMYALTRFNIDEFVDALKVFIEESDVANIELLATRLAPYRVEVAQVDSSSGEHFRPKLVLEKSTFLSDYVLDANRTPRPPPTSVPKESTFNCPPCPLQNVLPTVHPEVSEATAVEFGPPKQGSSNCPNQTASEPGIVLDYGYDSHLISMGQNMSHFKDGRRALYSASESSEMQVDLCQPTPLDLNVQTNLGQELLTDISYSPATESLGTFSNIVGELEALPVETIRGNDEAVWSLESMEESFPTGRLSHVSSPLWHRGTPEATQPSPMGNTSAGPIMVSDYIRSDCASFLETHLPRWTKNGLWHHAEILNPIGNTVGIEKMKDAYSCICQLELEMEDDPIRTRVALVLLHQGYETALQGCKLKKYRNHTILPAVGRGDATTMIDDMLKSIHNNWDEFTAEVKAKMRANFHNKKRFGKRWSILVNVLGPGILFCCSLDLARKVTTTTITTKQLETISVVANTCNGSIVKVLDLINPVAECLLRDEGYNDYDLTQVLTSIRNETVFAHYMS
ncbi:hypothetical protein F5884DRAFT_869271 [Xylogone sp. PMI_703]|nr:hypothetical protein F5884DRAFT_869271 [Xylogone sp. PMI_703]